MAVGVATTEITGRLVFDLSRGDETTTRVIEVPFAKTNVETVQAAVDAANTLYTSSTDAMNLLIQPANWRDSGTLEEQWTTTGVHYEIVSTTITPIEPE